MPTLMVVAVIPMSEAGTVPVGAAAGEVEPAADAAAGADVVAGAEVAGADVLLVLDELHPAASRTAATAAAATAANRVRLGIRRPVPPRPGDSLLGLIAVPSTTSLPVRFGPATPLRPWPRGSIYRAVSKKTEADWSRRWVFREFVYASAICKRLQHNAGM
jgi:hypothetical protein